MVQAHECNQIETIKNLQINQAVFMEKLDTVIEEQKKTNVKLDWLIEDLPNMYARKDSLDRLWKVIRWVIGIVFGAVIWTWLTMMFKYAYLVN